MKKFYITTPIYYPSDYLHIGHCYCTIAADTVARYKRLRGYEVFFLTGTDEHGEKIAIKAKEAGKQPKEYIDHIVEETKKLWKRLDISYDHYIRTTDDYHERRVQKIFQELYDTGDIYKGTYEGLYCVSDEAFFTETQAVKKDGDFYCPDCEKKLTTKKEECYYLRISKHAQWLIDYYKKHPEFLEPKERVNEMINNFLAPGLEDLAVSRKGMSWGIPVPFDESHTIYVWIDALSNYITALGYPEEKDELYKKFWPADIHLVGKEIVRFHAVIWPIVLKMLGIPLPKKVFGHGWVLFDDGKKMSKSRGNVIDPNIVIDKYGADSLRYFLMRDIVFGSDGYYSQESLLKRINSDLANDYGNLWFRITTMLEKYFGGALPEETVIVYGEREKELKEEVLSLADKVYEQMDNMQFSEALKIIWETVRNINKFVETSAPWNLAKDESKKSELQNVMYIAFQSFYNVTILLEPFFAETSVKVFERLGLEKNIPLDEAKKWNTLKKGIKIEKGGILFKRFDIEEEIGMKESENKDSSQKEEKKSDAENKKETAKEQAETNEISVEDFAKVQILTAKVLTAEKVENTDKLIKMTLDIGTEKRTVVSGIAEHYKPEEMIGKTVVYLANLKEKKLRGIMSKGMILCASNGSLLSCVTPETEMPAGSTVR